MGKKKSLSEVQRAQIVALHDQNLSERQISAQMGCSKTAVHQAIAKYQHDGSYTDKKRTGRPRVTTEREDNVMRRIVVRSPMSSMKKIRAELLRRGRRISHMTVSRRLSEEFNMKSYKPVKKPRLTAVMKAKHLQFANNHQHWTAEQWGKVLFSDKSTFQQFAVRKRHVRRPIGKRFDERYTIPTVKPPPSQMVWGGYVQKWCPCSQFPASRNHYEWAKIRANALREAKTLLASSQLSNIYAGWRPLPPFQSCKKFSG